ncbi:MAG: addiction module toxin RelE [Alphaproteobacteria bacterium]|nr:addiction module toxin RelE [Alphaproteobacteria bacterium]
MITVAETSIFHRRATTLLSPQAYDDLILFLALNPGAGDEIVGTGGIRKLRYAAKGKGKSGGVRVIYYYADAAMPLFALGIYGKGEQVELSADQRKRMIALVAELKARRKLRRVT